MTNLTVVSTNPPPALLTPAQAARIPGAAFSWDRPFESLDKRKTTGVDCLGQPQGKEKRCTGRKRGER